MDDGESCTIMWMYLVSLKCPVKYGSNSMFYVVWLLQCFFFFFFKRVNHVSSWRMLLGALCDVPHTDHLLPFLQLFLDSWGWWTGEGREDGVEVPENQKKILNYGAYLSTYSPQKIWGRSELDTTEAIRQQQQQQHHILLRKWGWRWEMVY